MGLSPQHFETHDTYQLGMYVGIGNKMKGMYIVVAMVIVGVVILVFVV